MHDRERLICLVSEDIEYDEIGQAVPSETIRKIFARVRSVSLNEWSQASQLGLSASYEAIVWSNEYHGEKVIEIEDRRYHVYRTYSTGDRIELYLEEMVGHGNQS